MPDPISPLRLGTWLSIGSPVIAELAAECGFDWVLMDLEHGFGTDANLLAQLQAIRGNRTDAIVRVGAPHPDLILRALDWGARGIMVPHISSAEEAAAVVAAAHYPPRGHRGFSRSARVYGYGLRPPGRSEEIVPPLIYAQIETLAGVERAEEIARVAGVDVLFVGPADLQFDLSVRAADHPPAYEECLQRVAQAAAAADKAAGVLIRQTAEIESFRKLGFSHLAIDSDLALLRKGWEAIVKTTAQP